jgi:cytochrome c oxidase subunit II
MYSGTSNFVEGVDTAFLVILGISAFFFIGITVILLVFMRRYHKSKNPVPTQIHGSTTLEIIWTVIPLILVIVMFFYGWVGYTPMRKAPDDAMRIKTVARMWNFTFEYENGKVTDTLYVPLDKSIRLDLVAMDVIHSLYIPAFRVKEDMVPGKESFMWFIAQREGTFDLFCTEYCGLRHSYMYTAVKVLPAEVFNAWYQDTTGLAPGRAAGDSVAVELPGLAVLKKNGCLACHSLDGAKIVGPSFKDSYGKTEIVIEKGIEKQIVIDDQYLIQSVYSPDEQIVKGYSKGMMQTYKGMVSDEEMQQIIEFVKSISK